MKLTHLFQRKAPCEPVSPPCERIESDLTTRTFQVNLSTLDEKTRSIEAVVITEGRVKVVDWQRYEVIEEVLLMDGCELPESRQVPLLDSHDRSTIQNQVGSTRDLRIENGRLIGRNYYSTSQGAEHAWTLCREGHLTDNSGGYAVFESTYLKPGESKEIAGRTWTASRNYTLRIGTRWGLRENSICAIGADEQAKNRKKDEIMLKPKTEKNEQRSEEDLLEQGAEQERRRTTEINKLGRSLNIDAEIIQRSIDDGTSVDDFKNLCLDEVRKQNENDVRFIPQIEVGDNLNLRSLPYAVTDAILCRAGVQLYKEDSQGNIIMDGNSPITRDRHSRADQFMGKRMPDIARILLVQAGDAKAIDYSDGRAIQKAIEIGQRSAPHLSTITLPTLLGNAMNKSLRASYVELPPQWNKFATKTQTNNFKEITRAQLQEINNLDVVGEGGEYGFAVIGETKEVYRVKKYGKIFGLSWESIRNDDLSAFSQIPLKLANAARRTEDQLVFGVLISTVTMNDGKVLFHADHGNLAGGGAVISIASLNAGKLAFRMQRGTNDGADVGYLNLTPKVLIVPATLEGHATQILESEKIQHSQAGDTDAETITHTANPWHKKLELCVHPVLDATSTTAWFLSTGQGGGGIEICFLDGATAPYLEREESFEVDAIRWKVRHVCASKAIDYKQLYKNAGA